MANTDKIHSIALIYAQRTGRELQITDELITDMQSNLIKLATEYSVHDTYNFYKEEE